MPNRVLQSSALTSESLSHLSAESERLFHRLVLVADDWGRFEARNSVIRSGCFPVHDAGISLGEIDEWLEGLIDQEIVYTYSSNGRVYGHFVNWWKYQRWRGNKSKHPEPLNGDLRENPQRRESEEVAANPQEVAANLEHPAAKTALSPLARAAQRDAATGVVVVAGVVVVDEDVTGDETATPTGVGAREAATGGGGGYPPGTSEFLRNLQTAYEQVYGLTPTAVRGEMQQVAAEFPDMPPDTGAEAVREAAKHDATQPWAYISRILDRAGRGEPIARPPPSRNGDRGKDAGEEALSEKLHNAEERRNRMVELREADPNWPATSDLYQQAAAREPPEEPE